MPEFGAATWLAGAALLLIALALVFLPVLGAKRAPTSAGEPTQQEALHAEQLHVVRRVRELDDDFRAGKLADADYHAMREPLIRRGADLLRQLDASACNSAS